MKLEDSETLCGLKALCDEFTARARVTPKGAPVVMPVNWYPAYWERRIEVRKLTGRESLLFEVNPEMDG